MMRQPVTLILCLAMILAACGGGGDDGAPEASPSDVAQPDGADDSTPASATAGATAEPVAEPTTATPTPGAADPSSAPESSVAAASYASSTSDLCLSIVRLEVAVQAAQNGQDTLYTEPLMAAVSDLGLQLWDNALTEAPDDPALVPGGPLDQMVSSAEAVRAALTNNSSGDFSEAEIDELYTSYDVVVQQGFAAVDSFPDACQDRSGDLPTFCTTVAEMLNVAASDPGPGEPLQQAFAQLVVNADSAVGIAPNGDAAATIEKFRQFAITFQDQIAGVGYDPDQISEDDLDALFDEVYPGFLTDVESGFNEFC